jgi:hypothetical protein
VTTDTTEIYVDGARHFAKGGDIEYLHDIDFAHLEPVHDDLVTLSLCDGEHGNPDIDRDLGFEFDLTARDAMELGYRLIRAAEGMRK